MTHMVEEQRAIGKTPVRLASERINRPEIPTSGTLGRKLEHNSASISAAGSRSAIEGDMAQNHPSSGAGGAVRAACKSVNDAERVSSIVFAMDFVNGAKTVRASGRRHPID